MCEILALAVRFFSLDLRMKALSLRIRFDSSFLTAISKYPLIIECRNSKQAIHTVQLHQDILVRTV